MGYKGQSYETGEVTMAMFDDELLPAGPTAHRVVASDANAQGASVCQVAVPAGMRARFTQLAAPTVLRSSS